MLTDLRLQHFRSYGDVSYSFKPGVTIIVGPNASGKTNLLEAILVVASGSSYRAKDAELVMFDQSWARIDGTLDNAIHRTVKIAFDPLLRKVYEFDTKHYKRLSLAHTLPVVLFEPNHLQLLSGSPERRRNYLDDLLEQTVPGYGGVRRSYKRTLAQRNTLLKQHTATIGQLFPWNVRLSQLAGQIVQARATLVTAIARKLGVLYEDLAHVSTEVTIEYLARWSIEGYESGMLQRLETSLETDRLRGFTSAGPHREDFVLSYDGHPAHETASRGEARTAILALKILELQILEASRSITPLLLLDDVFSELDSTRRQALTEHLSNYQTFITTTDADSIAPQFARATQIVLKA
jgi:DNA replication and repair protein RecF